MDRIGKYEILDKIGTGGFAVVYRGYDSYIRRPVAVKVCLSRDAETKERFRREAEIAGLLEHRNITTVFDAGVHNGTPYLVEEYLSGEDLAHVIRRQEPQALEKKLDFLIQIADGLGYAHSKGVIHRDIKPGNIRVLDNGRLKIMDFGTAKLANVESNLTQTGMTLGTVAYLSPERLLGQPSGTNSDIFSYGVLAYEVLAFRRPFSGRNIPNLIDQVLNASPVPLSETWPEGPSSLAKVVERCLLKDPAKRYPNCAEILKDLERVQAEVAPHMLRQESSTAIPQVDLQLSGLLERARQLFERGKYDRALVLLDEVLEIQPGHGEAANLLIACQQAQGRQQGNAPTASASSLDPSTSQGIWVPPASALPPAQPLTSSVATNPDQQRKIKEAADSIEVFIDGGDLVKAAEALRFARTCYGPAPELDELRQRLVAPLLRDLSTLKGEAFRQARSIVQRMQGLQQNGRLPLEIAERFAARVAELDPDDLAARHLLAELRRTARDEEESRRNEVSERKTREAVESIEKLLDEGDPTMAEKALQFAVRLFGDFEQRRLLQDRIEQARRQQG